MGSTGFLEKVRYSSPPIRHDLCTVGMIADAKTGSCAVIFWALIYKLSKSSYFFFHPCIMRGFSIRLRYLGMCDILDEHEILKYSLYPTILSISPPGTSSI